MLDLNQITSYVTVIASFLGGLAVLYRYIAVPSVKAVKKISHTSEELTKSLPILLELAGQFSKEGKLTLPDKIKELNDFTVANFELLKALGNKLKIAWYQSDLHGNYTYISDELAVLMGINLGQSLGGGWKNAVCEPYRENVIQEWMEAVKEKRELDINYAYCHGMTHKEVPVHVRAYPIKNMNSDVIGFIGIVTPETANNFGYQN